MSDATKAMNEWVKDFWPILSKEPCPPEVQYAYLHGYHRGVVDMYSMKPITYIIQNKANVADLIQKLRDTDNDYVETRWLIKQLEETIVMGEMVKVEC